jgi:hypothetical protein
MIGYGGRVLLTNGGECTTDRNLLSSSGLALISQRLYLTAMCATRTETINNVESYSGTPAAGATPVTCQMCIYQFNADGTATLLAYTANDTTLWSATYTAYKRALNTPFNKVAGQFYGVGTFINSAAAIPSLVVAASVNPGGLGAFGPLVAGPPRSSCLVGTGLTSLPATVTPLGNPAPPWVLTLWP